MPFDQTKSEPAPRNVTADNLRAAGHILRREGLWCKETWTRPVGLYQDLKRDVTFEVTEPQSCLTDAVHRAVRGVSFMQAIPPGTTSTLEIEAYRNMFGMRPEIRALAMSLPKNWPLTHPLNDPLSNVIAYNDDPATTYDDIMTLLAAAIMYAEYTEKAEKAVATFGASAEARWTCPG